MALLTLRQAKQHLRIADDDDAHNEEVSLKNDQAAGIVLDYLGSRANTIASISAANPAVITTETPHSLLSGDTVVIADTVTTPTVNGTQIVTVTGAKTFTVPVAVTVGQSDVLGTVTRQPWTDVNAPGPVQSATQLVLGHLYENRGDDMKTDSELWDAVVRLLRRLRDPALA